MIGTDLLFFVGSCIFLVVGAEFLVKSLTKVALFFRISDFMVGFMVVAIATSIPELFIGITSALKGNPELSMGNVIGSNIIDLTLIVGIMALLKQGVKIETVAVRIDALYMFLISLLPIIFVIIDGMLDKFEGFLLVAVFFLYLVKVLSQRGRFREETFDKRPPRSEMLKNCGIAVFALVVLIVSANYLVKYATLVSNDLISPSILVGLFLVSIGTTLPELIFGSGAILMKHKYMAFGDIIGSVVANTTLVLGVVALISPLPLTPDIVLFLTSNFFMVVVAFLFATFVDVEKHILWQEGVALIMLYVLFIIVILNIRVIEMSGVAG